MTAEEIIKGERRKVWMRVFPAPARTERFVEVEATVYGPIAVHRPTFDPRKAPDIWQISAWGSSGAIGYTRLAKDAKEIARRIAGATATLDWRGLRPSEVDGATIRAVWEIAKEEAEAGRLTPLTSPTLEELMQEVAA